MDSWFADWLDS